MIKSKQNLTPVCPYCNQQSQHVKGDKIYPHRKDLYDLDFYYCDNGHDPAYTGCHIGTLNPKGSLADKKTRLARIKAHAVFDPIWRHTDVKRKDAYAWLAKEMGMTKKECHIGYMSKEEATKVFNICKGEINIG